MCALVDLPVCSQIVRARMYVCVCVETDRRSGNKRFDGGGQGGGAACSARQTGHTRTLALEAHEGLRALRPPTLNLVFASILEESGWARDLGSPLSPSPLTSRHHRTWKKGERARFGMQPRDGGTSLRVRHHQLAPPRALLVCCACVMLFLLVFFSLFVYTSRA